MDGEAALSLEHAASRRTAAAPATTAVFTRAMMPSTIVSRRSPAGSAALNGRSEPPELHLGDPMIGALLQHERRAGLGRGDVLAQVASVDLAPDEARRLDRVLLGEVGIVAEEAVGILEHRLAQREEPVDVPALDVAFVGVQIDAEVEVVTDELVGDTSDLEDVETLEDQDVGLRHDGLFAVDDVVHHVAVDRRAHFWRATLDRPQEVEQTTRVVALREPLSIHDPALFEHLVRVQETVGRDEADLRVIGPSGKQRAQDARKRALAYGDAAGDT